jgi:tripartite ATP-independent transporter DctP family solute receptor
MTILTNKFKGESVNKTNLITLASASLVFLSQSAIATTITLASTAPNSGVNKVVVDKFKEELKERAPDVELEIFLDGSLGGERELIDLVKMNETQIHMGVIHSSQYFPELDATLVPYLFPDYESIQSFFESETGDRIKVALKERGNAQFLNTYYQGARWTTSNTPFRTLEELQGVKIRMPEIPLWIDIWSGLGATTTPMASPEVFSGLQTGVIDAQENMLSNIVGRRLHEVQDYLIATQHQHSYVTTMVNLDFWNGLDEDVKTAIQESMSIATEEGTARALDENDDLIQEILSADTELVEPDPSFREDAMPVIEQAARDVLEEGVYEDAVRTIKEGR